jgi:hypothetical protein
MKKLLFMLGIMAGWVWTGAAQVTVEVVLDQQQYLPSESLPVAVKITNRSGQTIHLGEDPLWLTFSVESEDGFVVIKNGDAPVVEPFDLESGQMATKRVDLEPWFTLNKAGRYHVVATLRIKDWSAEEASAPSFFDVINGVTIWSQEIGLPVPPGAASNVPEVRLYSLVKANYLKSQLRLYAEVSDPGDARIYKVVNVGPLVSFSQPEAQVDRTGNLQVLYQSGGTLFSYTVLDPNGEFVSREIFDYVNSRPRLSVNTNGDLTVIGGVRRLKPTEMPRVKMPNEVFEPARQ